MPTVQELCREVYEETEAAWSPENVIRRIARHVLEKVGDAKMHHVVAMRVARALVDHKISRAEVDELLDIVEAKRKRGELRSPGAYFVTSIKRIFERAEVIWSQPPK